MMVCLLLHKPIIYFTWTMFPEVPRCCPWFLSIVIRSLMTPGWNVISTTTINAYGVAHTCFVGYMPHFCSMRPCSASFAENILMAILPEMICTSTGGASYLRPTCAPMGAGARLHLAPSIWIFHWSSFGLSSHYSHLFLGSSKRVDSFYLTSVMGRSDIFRLASTIGLGVDVSHVAPCCKAVLPTGGMGL